MPPVGFWHKGLIFIFDNVKKRPCRKKTRSLYTLYIIDFARKYFDVIECFDSVSIYRINWWIHVTNRDTQLLKLRVFGSHATLIFKGVSRQICSWKKCCFFVHQKYEMEMQKSGDVRHQLRKGKELRCKSYVFIKECICSFWYILQYFPREMLTCHQNVLFCF